MPVIIDTKILDSRVIVWDLKETDLSIATFLNCFDDMQDDKFRKSHLRMTYGWQYVLKKSLGNHYDGIFKDEHGKPFLNQQHFHIAVTHTKQFIACAIHTGKPVGVDIEPFSDKIGRVRHKFMNEVELLHCQSSFDQTMVWCAKEAAYKLNGKKGVSFKQQIYIDKDAGNIYLEGKIMANFESITVEDMMLVVAVGL